MIVIGVNGEGVDESDLLTSRTCIIAQSGAGKSYGVAVICEQLASENLGFCIIDTEGEYASLKQKYEVLWVGGESADVNVSTIDLNHLASIVIKESIPLIFDISDLPDEKVLVSDWIKALYEASTKHRNPYLLIIEEADKFVPQRGEKLSVIHEVARRGRKRGLGLLVASQRPALVSKGVLSQCNHQLIGKLTVENDLKAVNHFFSSRKELKSLPDLLPGEFFMIGFKPDESLFKFKERLTSHDSATPVIKERLPARIQEVIDSLSLKPASGLGVKTIISKDEAEQIALDNCQKKFYLLGRKEWVESIRLFHKPLIELSLKVPRRKLLRQEFVELTSYFTNDFKVVDKDFKLMFDLSFMKELSRDQVRALIALLYEGARTVSDLKAKADLPDEEARKLLKDLLAKGFINHSEWSGREKVYKVIRNLSLPRVTSLGSDRLEASESVNEDFSFDVELLKRVIQSLDYKATIVGTKVIYYPFYKAVLKRDDVSRELLINGVNGGVM